MSISIHYLMVSVDPDGVIEVDVPIMNPMVPNKNLGAVDVHMNSVPPE